MARFSDEPIKNPLAGNEILAATDPSSTDDVGMTPFIITQFAQKNMTLASGTTQGLVSGPNGAKLNALPTEASLASQIAQLAEVALPVFIGSPADGFFNFYQHPILAPWVLDDASFYVSAGSTNLTLTKNGVPLGGMTSIPVTTAGVGSSFTDPPPANTLNSGDFFGVTFTGTTGNCANLTMAIAANATITP